MTLAVAGFMASSSINRKTESATDSTFLIAPCPLHRGQVSCVDSPSEG